MKRLIRIFFRLLGGLVAILIVALAIIYGCRPKLERVPVPSPKPISGAAVFYEEAFAAMPELSGEEKKLFDQSKPLDEDVAQGLVQKWEAPLELLAKGAATEPCEWAVNPFPRASNPKPKLLVNVAMVRARLHLLKGENSKAVDDLLMAFRFSRHLGGCANGIVNAEALSCNTIAMRAAAFHLRALDRNSLQAFSQGIDSLPPLPSLWDGEERDFRFLHAFLHNTYSDELESPSPKTNPPPKDYLSSCHRFVSSGVRFSPLICYLKIRAFDRRSTELFGLMKLPFAQRQPQIAAFCRRVKEPPTCNKLVGAFWLNPCTDILRAAETAQLNDARYQTLWAVFRTALQAQLDDPETVRTKIAGFRNPIDGTPLQIEDTPGEVRLVVKGRKDMSDWDLRLRIALQREPYWR